MKHLSETDFTKLRYQMVYEQLERRGVTDPVVLDSMRKVPRHLFVPPQFAADSYKDGPLSIGEGQTISQPYVVGSMTAHLHLTPDSKVLEVGTGSGYQTAVLAEIANEVFSIERIDSLLDKARLLFGELKYENIRTRLGDGTMGWPEEAPFDAILVTAAAKSIPEHLTHQLKEGGVMVIPIERGLMDQQELIKITKSDGNIQTVSLYPVRFVPLLNDIVS